MRSHTPELLEVEAEWQPESSKPPVHFHPSQDERFEVSEGELRVNLDGEERTLRAGDTLVIPRGTPHSMWATQHSRAN